MNDAARRLTGRHADHPLRGIALIVASTVFLACSDTLAKYLGRTLPPIEIGWIRFLVFVLIMLPVALASSSASPLRSVRPKLQVLRALALVASSVLFISGLKFLPIAEASATSFIAPLFVTALSIVLLAETIGIRRWVATLVGLIGVLIVIRPGSAAFNPAVIFPILSALSWAITLILTRMISGADRAVVTMTFSALVGFITLSAMVPFVWVTPSWHDIAVGIAVGLASTMGQWIVVLAYRYADASVLAPFTYSQLVWVSLLGFGLFAEIPDLWTFVGAAVIIGSGIYTAHRERLRRKQTAMPVEPTPNP
jgi:drug/metabolite transporter (DMT)-like permease